MILTLFLLHIYFFLGVLGESIDIVYYNTKNVQKKPYKKTDLPSTSSYYTSKSQTKSKYTYTKTQQAQNYPNLKKKQSFKYYSIATLPLSKTNTLKTLPNVQQKSTKSISTQYYNNINVKPTAGYKYYLRNNYLRPYQYYYYPNTQYYTQYNYPTSQYNYPASQYYYPTSQTQYNYQTSQSQYNYASNQPSILSPLQYELSYPHKGHGFFGNELAQFWLICHDCPRG